MSKPTRPRWARGLLGSAGTGDRESHDLAPFVGARASMAALSFGLTAACSVYDPSLLASGTSDAEAETCAVETIPDRPTEDRPGTSSIAFGLRDAVLNQTDGVWRAIGLDQDNECTRASTAESGACSPMEGARPRPDGDRGIDNAFGSAFGRLYLAADPALELDVRAASAMGVGALLLVIDGYDPHHDDDARVQVSLFHSALGTRPSEDGSPRTIPSEGPNGLPAPSWDGRDHFYARDDGYVEDRPTLVDGDAYVANRTLVASFPGKTEIFFAGTTSTLVLPIHELVVFGTLASDGSVVSNATLAGRLHADDALAAAPHAGLCPGSSAIALLTNLIGTDADLRATPEAERCNAIGVGIRLTGHRVEVVGRYPGPPRPNPCPP